MLKNLSKKLRYQSIRMLLGFLFITMNPSLSYSSGGAEEQLDTETTSSQTTSSQNIAGLSKEDEKQVLRQEMNTAIDKYFIVENPNKEEKIVKNLEMDLRESTGMKIQVLLDRNLVNQKIDGAYVYQNGESKIEFKGSSGNTVGKIISKTDLDELVKDVLKKIFKYDPETDSFKILNLNIDGYKWLHSYIQSIKMHDKEPMTNFTSQGEFINIIKDFFFENTYEERKGNSNGIILIKDFNIEKLFEVNWTYRQTATETTYPALMGYYSGGVFTKAPISEDNNRDIYSTLKKVFSLEQVYYPAHNKNDGGHAYPDLENAGLFPKPVFAGNAVATNGPYVMVRGASQPLNEGLIDFFFSRMIDALNYDYIINATDDISLSLTIDTDSLIKAFGATEKYKGLSPSA